MSSHLINRHINAYIFDYGGTLDTGGHHWGKVLWHAWQQAGISVSEARFREAYIYAERTLTRERIVLSSFTFRQTLETKLRIELEYVGLPGYLPTLLDVVYKQAERHTEHSREVLQLLAERCPLALVSNFYGNIHTVLNEFGFDGLFQHVMSWVSESLIRRSFSWALRPYRCALTRWRSLVIASRKTSYLLIRLVVRLFGCEVNNGTIQLSTRRCLIVL